MKPAPWMAGLALLATAPLCRAQAAPKDGVSFQEKRLAVVPDEAEFGDSLFFPGGTSVAYVGRKDGKMFVVSDGKKGEELDDVSRLTLGPDGRTIAYAGRKDGKASIVVGTQRGPEFDGVQAPIFSPDGRSVAYTASQLRKAFVVVGGKRGEDFDHVWHVRFSLVGSTITYLAQRAGKLHVVVGDKVGKGFDESAGPPTLYPNGMAGYQGKRAGNNLVVFGERELQSVGPPTMSADGRTLAYIGYSGDILLGKKWVVVGEQKGEEFDGVTGLTFSPNGKVVGYSGYLNQKGRAFYTVVGDTKVAGHLLLPVFSPDGMTVAYSEMGRLSFLVSTDGGLTYATPPPGSERKPSESIGYIRHLLFSPDGKTVAGCSSGAGKQFVFLGDKRSEGFEQFGGFKFSPDSKTLVYWAKTGDKWFVVVGDRKGDECDELRSEPVFHSDGTIAYLAKKGLKEIVVLGEKEFESDTLPVMSPDGRTFASVVFKGSGRNRKVCVSVGPRTGEDFEEIKAGPFFSADSRKVAYGGVKGREFWWKVMEVKP